MRRARWFAVFMLVTASCGHPPRRVETTDHGDGRAASPVAEPTLELQPPTTTTTTTAPPAAAVVPVLRVPAVPVPDCGGWEAEVAAAFGLVDAPRACRILVCESRGDPQARNRSGASGLFQIMPVHGWRFEARGWVWGDVMDGDRNIQVAADIHAESGWRPWTCQ